MSEPKGVVERVVGHRPRRLAGPSALLFLLAFLAAAIAACGGALVLHGRAEAARMAGEARFLVVVRSALVEAARQSIAEIAGVRTVAERPLDELLPQLPGGRARADRLRVIEAVVDAGAAHDALDSTAAALRGVDGAVDVVDANAAERSPEIGERAQRWIAAGIALLACGLVGFAIGVGWIARFAVREEREELTVRLLLGADPRRAWKPLGISLTAAATLGTVSAWIAVALASTWLGSGDPAGFAGGRSAAAPAASQAVASHAGRTVAASAAVLLAASAGLAAWSARRSVERAARSWLGGLLVAVLLGSLAPAGLRSAHAQESWPEGVPGLRAAARELVVSRRALHRAEQAVVASEFLTVRAAAADDPVTARLAAAQLAIDREEVERWREACDRLVALRTDLRDSVRTDHAGGPPIEPRLAPVTGRIALGFGADGSRVGLRGFRHGIAWRTRAGDAVRASAPGRVSFAGELAGLGAVVVLNHGRRTYSVYGRLGELLVARGMEVTAGEPIGRASEGGLVYFGVRERGDAIDPVAWLLAGEKSADRS